MKGVVKFFNDAKGWGFVTPADKSPEVFVHYSGIKKEGKERRTLHEGDEVEFLIEQGEKGPKAVEVEVL